MSNFIAVGDVVECKFFCKMGNQESINVLHWKSTAQTGVGVTDLEFAAAISAIAGPVYKGFLPSVGSYEGCHAQIINPTKRPWVFSTSGNGVGDNAFDPLPTQAAALVLKRTDVVTEGARGRTFLPFWTETHSGTDGKINVAGLAKVSDWITAMLVNAVAVVGGLGTGTLEPRLWSREFATSRVMTELKINPAWATHKSRSQINRGDAFGV